MSDIEHGGPGCTCVTDPEAFGFGENPKCPHHGYEAVIARLNDQLQGAVEDARMAGDLSLQAAFWRARAIELGASEDEFRKAHPLGGQSTERKVYRHIDAPTTPP